MLNLVCGTQFSTCGAMVAAGNALCEGEEQGALDAVHSVEECAGPQAAISFEGSEQCTALCTFWTTSLESNPIIPLHAKSPTSRHKQQNTPSGLTWLYLNAHKDRYS